MSAFPPIATIERTSRHVSKVPQASSAWGVHRMSGRSLADLLRAQALSEPPRMSAESSALSTKRSGPAAEPGSAPMGRARPCRSITATVHCVTAISSARPPILAFLGPHMHVMLKLPPTHRSKTNSHEEYVRRYLQRRDAGAPDQCEGPCGRAASRPRVLWAHRLIATTDYD